MWMLSCLLVFKIVSGLNVEDIGHDQFSAVEETAVRDQQVDDCSGLTGPQDQYIRDRLDHDMEMIDIRLNIATKRIAATLAAHPTSPRAIYNQLLVTVRRGEDSWPQGLALGLRLLALPSIQVAYWPWSLYHPACRCPGPYTRPPADC